MNSGLESSHVSIQYYDGDYPSKDHSPFPENFDQTTVLQGLSHDVQRYTELAREIGGPILELCCGTGRVAIPLAKDGFDVTGVDICAGMLEQLRKNLQRLDPVVSAKVTSVEQDITQLSLKNRNYRLAIIAFNSLLCVTNFNDQLKTLTSISRHLSDEGILILDIVNPLKLKIEGDPVPRAFFTRKNTNTGNTYTRFAMSDAFDENHRQRLHGWYDEIDSEGSVTRRHYSLYWRPIFRFEIEMMLEKAGFRVEKLEGGHLGESYSAQSPRMLIQARAERQNG
jgi:ubiquinone/menaquinone biosynthesis C-methylase UbiE